MRDLVKWWMCLVLMAAGLGCAGGLPRIPNDPQLILAEGDKYLGQEKYFQAQELYKGFLTRYPGHERSDYAQYQLAESYRLDKEYPMAAVEYRVLISDYGYSEYVDDAFFKEAVCFFEQAPKFNLDQTKSFEALSRFNQFLITFSSSPLAGEVKEYIARIHSKLASKDLKNAKFYIRHKRIKSAHIYLDKILKLFPNNDAWAEAMYLKATLLLGQNKPEEAKKLFRSVVDYPKEFEFTAVARAELEQLKAE